MNQPNQDNVQVLVQGTVDYSRVASHIEGDELARRVARDRSKFPTNTPHTLLEISNIQIYRTGPAGQDGYPSATEAEAFVEGKAFTRKDPEKGLCLTLENKTKSLPALLVRNAETGQYEQVVQPQGEIAPGTQVQVVLRVFYVPQYAKKGINLEAVLFSTPTIPYTQGRGLDLSAYGISLAGPIVATQAAAGTQAAPEQHEGVAAGTDASTGLPAAPSQAPAQNQGQAQAPQGYGAPAQQGYGAPQAPTSPVVPPAPQYQAQAPQFPTQQAPQAPQNQGQAQGGDPFAGQGPQWAGQGIVAPE